MNVDHSYVSEVNQVYLGSQISRSAWTLRCSRSTARAFCFNDFGADSNTVLVQFPRKHGSASSKRTRRSASATSASVDPRHLSCLLQTKEALIASAIGTRPLQSDRVTSRGNTAAVRKYFLGPISRQRFCRSKILNLIRIYTYFQTQARYVVREL